MNDFVPATPKPRPRQQGVHPVLAGEGLLAAVGFLLAAGQLHHGTTEGAVLLAAVAVGMITVAVLALRGRRHR